MPFSLILYRVKRSSNQQVPVAPKRVKLENEPVSDLFPLEKLPEEIKWMIFDYVQDSLYELRKTSRAIRDSVKNYSISEWNRRKETGFAPDLGIVEGIDDNTLTINVPFSDQDAALFKLSLIASHPSALAHTKWHDVYSGGEKVEYCMDLSNFNVKDVHNFLECIGGRFDVVSVDTIDEKHASSCAKILEETSIDELKIEMPLISTAARTVILDIVRECKVEILHLTVERVTGTNQVAFLHEVSSLVSTLRIDQGTMEGIARTKKFLFGLHRRNWSSIILEMFSRKLQFLHIENESYMNYLSHAHADILREQLPHLNKAIEFLATYHSEDKKGLDYASNGFAIKSTPFSYMTYVRGMRFRANSALRRSTRPRHISIKRA